MVDHAEPRLLGPGLSRARASVIGGADLQVSRWQGRRDICLVRPARDTAAPSSTAIEKALLDLNKFGVRQAVTPAMHLKDCEPFLAVGFKIHEELHLLSLPLTGPLGRPLPDKPKASAISVSPGRPWNRGSTLTVDRLAFENFWQFDHTSLKEARKATPVSRFRVVKKNMRVVGYAVSGKAGSRGYLQRLAVEPVHEGQGFGTALINDTLSWLYRKGCRVALVNTQQHNCRALSLYQHLGFVREPSGLTVLRWDVQR